MNTARNQGSGTGPDNTSAMSAAGDNPTPGVLANVEIWNGSSWFSVNSLNTAKENPESVGTVSAALNFGGGDGTAPIANNEKVGMVLFGLR